MSSADRVARFRRRQRGLAPDLPRCSCGRLALGQHSPLCSRCWAAGPGRAELARQKRERRAELAREKRGQRASRKGGTSPTA